MPMLLVCKCRNIDRIPVHRNKRPKKHKHLGSGVAWTPKGAAIGRTAAACTWAVFVACLLFVYCSIYAYFCFGASRSLGGIGEMAETRPSAA